MATLTRELEARGGVRRVVGHSKQWKDVLAQATRVAQTETTVLLTGESGTGKEVVARFLHHGSRRNHGPFIAINCAALPDQLLESELFGHERGAFTGAVATKPGRIEQAAGGVLFLDEVGEMAPTVQAKLLRVLEEREFMRLGSTRVMRADIRVIAATNRDLHAAIQRGEFREDLYYRLGVFEIHLPPLRERLDDILELAEMFLAEIGETVGRPAAGISRDAKEQLLAYGWPGNVRELRNAIERAVILADGGHIRGEHLPVTSQRAAAAGPVVGHAGRRCDEPGRDRAVAGGERAGAGALQQDARGQAARPHPRTAVLTHREIRARGARTLVGFRLHVPRPLRAAHRPRGAAGAGRRHLPGRHHVAGAAALPASRPARRRRRASAPDLLHGRRHADGGARSASGRAVRELDAGAGGAHVAHARLQLRPCGPGLERARRWSRSIRRSCRANCGRCSRARASRPRTSWPGTGLGAAFAAAFAALYPDITAAVVLLDAPKAEPTQRRPRHSRTHARGDALARTRRRHCG